MAGTINQFETAWHGTELRGRGLRFLLTAELQRRRTMTVAEMVELTAAHGFTLTGRASKVISDALRWEVARGRVVRTGRGVYGYGRAPRTTARRVRIFARQCLAWTAAVARGETPPPLPPVPRHRAWHSDLEDPYRPPWPYLDWLWST